MPGRRQAVGAGAFSALQMSVTFRTRHQGKAGLHLHGLARTDLSAVQGVTGDRLRTRKPFIHAVVAVSAVSAVQMSTPRGQSLADALPASCWPDRLVLVSVTRQRRREGRGASKVWSLLTGNRSLPSFFACAGFEGVGYPPPIMGPSWTFSTTGRFERENALVTLISNYLTLWFTAERRRVTIGRAYQKNVSTGVQVRALQRGHRFAMGWEKALKTQA